jgi:hypothetical protein
MKPVEGACFKISLPKQELKTAAFCFKWGIVAIKIALATQGLGGIVPDISTLLPGMDMDAAQKMIEEMTEATGVVGEAVKHAIEGKVEAAKGAAEEEFKSLSDGASASKVHIRVIYDLIAAGLHQDKKTAFDKDWKPDVYGLKWGMELVAVDGKSVWASKEGAVKLRKNGLKALDRTAKRDLDRDVVKVGEDKQMSLANMAMKTVSFAVSSLIQKAGIDIHGIQRKAKEVGVTPEAVITIVECALNHKDVIEAVMSGQTDTVLEDVEDEIADELQDKEGMDPEVTKAVLQAIYLQNWTALEALAIAEAQEVKPIVESLAVKEGGDVLGNLVKRKTGGKTLIGKGRANVATSPVAVTTDGKGT